MDLVDIFKNNHLKRATIKNDRDHNSSNMIITSLAMFHFNYLSINYQGVMLSFGMSYT